MIPQYAGFGNLIPGMSAGSFPQGPGYSTSPNGMNGYNYNATTPAGGGITPWVPPGGNYGVAAPATGSPGGMIPTSSGGSVGGGGSYLSNLLSQISATPSPSVPALPDLGIKNQGVSNMLNYQQYMQNQANADNNQRFNWAVEALQGQGTAANQDIQRQQTAEDAANSQDMISRGLTNTTIEPTLKMGTAEAAQRASQRVNEGVAQQLVNLLQSKSETGPNAGQMFSMMQGAMASPNPNLMSMYGMQSPYGGYTNYGPMMGANVRY